MNSREYSIEVFKDEKGNLSFGCPEWDLWGFTDINYLIKCIEMGTQSEYKQKSQEINDINRLQNNSKYTKDDSGDIKSK